MISYTYDAANRRATMQVPGQALVTYAYDNADRLTGVTQGAVVTTYGNDAANRRTSATLPNGVTAAYVYDTASQLTSITYMSGATTLGTLTYTYDAAGHVSSRGSTLFQSVLPAAVTSATYNLANRLTARTAAGVTASPVWDTNGSLTSDGLRTYTWDSRNRLTAISGLATYAYDALGDGRQRRGLGVDERLSRGASTVLTDALGSTAGLASADAVQTRYGYDPYGVASVTGTASANPFQFTGRENDSGTGLLNYRNRYYNPMWGRFVSEDPIGIAGGVNAYHYVYNNPVQLRDPSGLLPHFPNPLGPSPTGGDAFPIENAGCIANFIRACAMIVGGLNGSNPVRNEQDKSKQPGSTGGTVITGSSDPTK